MSNMTPEQIQQRGDNARRILEDKVFCEAVTAVSAEFEKAVFATSLAQHEKREEAFAAYSGFREALKAMRRWVTDAEVSRENNKPQE